MLTSPTSEQWASVNGRRSNRNANGLQGFIHLQLLPLSCATSVLTEGGVPRDRTLKPCVTHASLGVSQARLTQATDRTLKLPLQCSPIAMLLRCDLGQRATETTNSTASSSKSAKLSVMWILRSDRGCLRCGRGQGQGWTSFRWVHVDSPEFEHWPRAFHVPPASASFAGGTLPSLHQPVLPIFSAFGRIMPFKYSYVYLSLLP